MGCVSSTFLDDDDSDILQPTAVGHHIVSLTSTTYGILNTLDHLRTCPTSPPPPPPTPPPPPSVVLSARAPRTILSDSSEVTSLTKSSANKENPHRAPPFSRLGISPNTLSAPLYSRLGISPNTLTAYPTTRSCFLPFENWCPPAGEAAAVLYTTTLRGVRKTYADCNAVRAAMEGTGVRFRERDVSMDAGFREELRRLMRGSVAAPPRLFVRGRYIGGAEEVMRLHEDGGLARLVAGLPPAKERGSMNCQGCGGVRFLMCFQCNGSRKVAAVVEGGAGDRLKGKVVRCPHCNENGLVLCPICS